jgi:tRNA pseudouridine38-40 synthase
MYKYAIEIAYNGKRFHGWQKQLNAVSVQNELDTKLSILLRQQTETLGCGRTDTGVHAKQFIAHFNTVMPVDGLTLAYKLNRLMIKDIVCKNIWPVNNDFNARFDAKWREYEYIITTKPNPFLVDYALLYSTPLNIEDMNNACKILLKHTNFECFSKVHTQVNNFNCNLMEANWRLDGDLLIFTIRANRFLRNMVRAIVGTLLKVGLKELDLTELEQILASKNRSNAGVSVPAHGLYLTKVVYK